MPRYRLFITSQNKGLGMNRRLLTAKEVRAIYGDVTQMTLWRWLNDQSLGFPRPIYINRRRYFHAEEIEQFKLDAARKSLSKSAS